MALTIFSAEREPIRRSAPMFLVWGLVALLLGVAILVWPQLTTQVLVALLGSGVLASGLALLYWSLRLRTTSVLWILPLVPGLTLAALGTLTLLRPELVATFFVVIVAVVAILAGVGDIAMSLAWRSFMPVWWVRLLRGALLVVLGVWVVSTPVSGLVALGWLLGVLAIGVGALSIWLGVLVRRA